MADSTQAQGRAKPSFTASLIERDANPSVEQELIYKWVSSGLYSGKKSAKLLTHVLIYLPSFSKAGADTARTISFLRSDGLPTDLTERLCHFLLLPGNGHTR